MRVIREAAATPADLDGEPSVCCEERFLREQNKFAAAASAAAVVIVVPAIAVSALHVVTYLLCLSRQTAKPETEQQTARDFQHESETQF